jgi:hypothetical protein
MRAGVGGSGRLRRVGVMCDGLLSGGTGCEGDVNYPRVYYY